MSLFMTKSAKCQYLLISAGNKKGERFTQDDRFKLRILIRWSNSGDLTDL